MLADAGHQGSFDDEKQVLEMYMFLLHWLIVTAETKVMPSSDDAEAPGPAAAGGKKKKVTKKKTEEWEWTAQKEKALQVMESLLELRLGRIWHMDHERDNFISVFTKPIYIILEGKENLKDATITALVYNIIGLCVKLYNHGFTATTSIMQCLSYFEHLAEPMADLLGVLYTKYDESKVTEDVLR